MAEGAQDGPRLTAQDLGSKERNGRQAVRPRGVRRAAIRPVIQPDRLREPHRIRWRQALSFLDW